MWNLVNNSIQVKVPYTVIQTFVLTNCSHYHIEGGYSDMFQLLRLAILREYHFTKEYVVLKHTDVVGTYKSA